MKTKKVREEILKYYLEKAYDEKFYDHNKEDSHYKTLRKAAVNLALSNGNDLLIKALELAILDIG